MADNAKIVTVTVYEQLRWAESAFRVLRRYISNPIPGDFGPVKEMCRIGERESGKLAGIISECVVVPLTDFTQEEK